MQLKEGLRDGKGRDSRRLQRPTSTRAPAAPNSASSYSTAGTDSKGHDGSYAPAQASSFLSSAADAGPSSHHDPEAIPSYAEATSQTGGMPTVESPFSFPITNEPLPAYEAEVASSGPSKPRPIAIPQVSPDAAAPFLEAYPPSLLAHGITEPTWRSFLETISAFLTAKVSDRAIAHAGDVAKSIGEAPRDYGMGLVNHTKSAGKLIAREAKRFNVIGVVAGAVGAAVSIPLHATFGAIDTILKIPTSAIAASSKMPKTPLQRAATYAAVASKDWLNARGLQAVLLNGEQLSEMLQITSSKLRELGKYGKGGNALLTMRSLEGHIMPLKSHEDEILILHQNTLWLVLVPFVAN